MFTVFEYAYFHDTILMRLVLFDAQAWYFVLMVVFTFVIGIADAIAAPVAEGIIIAADVVFALCAGMVINTLSRRQ